MVRPARGLLGDHLLGGLLAIVVLFYAPPVAALGLGELRTQSALNQPFYAEIDLFDIDERALDSVKVSLASRSAFEQAGIERPHFLTGLQFTPMIGPSGEPMVQVSTREPVREPYLDLLVEVIWPEGRLVKEYSVLLDPPAIGGARRAPAAPPRVDRTVQSPFAAAAERERSIGVESNAPESSSAQGADNAVGASSGSTQAATLASADAPDTPDPETLLTDVEIPDEAANLRFPINYGPVPSGTGLAMIARRLAPPGATLEQTLMAFYRNSQDAFINADINRLSVGAELVIPTAAELFALGPEAARKQYRAALAGRPVVKAPLTDVDARLTIATPESIELDDPESEVDDSGSVEDTQVDLEVPVSAAAVESETSLGSASGLASGAASSPVAARALSEADASLEAELLLMREVSEANRQEASELRARVQELEAQLDDIGRLLELRHAQLASLATERLADGPRGLESELSEGSAAAEADGEQGPESGSATGSASGPRSDLESGPESAPEGAFERPAAQAGSEGESASATGAGDVGPKTVEHASGFDLFAMAGAWRQAILSWALPLLAMTLLLALLGVILHRRRQQATAVAGADLAKVPNPQDDSPGDSLNDLRLDPEWPTTDALSASRTDVEAPVATTDDVLVTAADQHPALAQAEGRQEEVFPSGLARAEVAATEQDTLEESLPDREGVTSDQDLVGRDLASWGMLPAEESRAGPGLAERELAELSLDQGLEPSADEQPVDLGQAVEQGRWAALEAVAPAAAHSIGSQPDQAAAIEVDGLAEADVYLTYGRYRDAERVLRETIAAAGESPELRYKLAETYLASGDLAALALLADQMRLAAQTELDSERWAKIENALTKQSPESGSSVDDAVDDIGEVANEIEDVAIEIDEAASDQEELFLDLEDLEQELSEVAPTTTSQQPSQPDHADGVDLPADEQGRLELDLAALDAMTNLEPDQTWPPEPEPEPEPELQTLSPEALTASGSADDLQWPILASLPDDQEADAESDPERSLTVLPADDEGDLDRSPTAVPTAATVDERWPLEAGDGWDEIALKLDLAHAYLDMGDRDAASAILKEVIAGGREEQRREAEFLLAGLGWVE